MDKTIYFDGICNLCNWAVRFIIRYDKKQVFSFAALQSDHAKKSLLHVNGQDIKLKTVIYQDADIVLVKSDAVFRIMYELGSYWKLLLVFKILPRLWRDGLYDIIAKRRYAWFGKEEKCLIPNEDISSRFHH